MMRYPHKIGGAERPIRVGNCSGFYGDRLSAMCEMLEGGRLDSGGAAN